MARAGLLEGRGPNRSSSASPAIEGPGQERLEGPAASGSPLPSGYWQHYGAPRGAGPVQMRGMPGGYWAHYGVQLRGDGAADSGAVHDAARAATSGAAGPLPHAEAIQRSFGRHDLSGIQAHTDGAAEAGVRRMGAEAFASGSRVAFAGAPSLHTAAHEAAHVVQQRAGVHLKGGVGEAGDAHEQHADAVADLVVQGRSAESLLDAYAGASSSAPSSSGAAGGGVQRKLVARGGDRYFGDRTGTDYVFKIEEAREERHEGPEGEEVIARFGERPVFVDQSTDKALAPVTVASRELDKGEKLSDFMARFGLSQFEAESDQSVRRPDAITLTNGARKGLLLTSYVDILEDKKRTFHASAKWSDSLEAQLTTFKDHVARKNTLAAWQVLKVLLQRMNAVKGVKGAGAVPMTEEERASIRKAVPVAKGRAIGLLLGLYGDQEAIRREFRIVEQDDVNTIKSNLQKIALHLGTMTEERFLLDEDGSLAFSRGGALNSGQGGGATIKISRFFLDHSLDRQAAELVHEASHGTPGVATKDVAYVGSWADAIVQGKSAMINAPTYERAIAKKGVELHGGEAVGQKQLAITAGQEGLRGGLVSALGKLDFHVTQAWWFVNNVANFAKAIPSDQALTQDVTDMGYRWSALVQHPRYRYVTRVVAQIGAPAAKSQGGRTRFTSLDQELIDLYIRLLARTKDAVDGITSVEIVDNPPDQVVEGPVARLTAAQAAEDAAAIGLRLTSAIAPQVHVPASFTQAKTFYAMIVEASGWKDGVEPDVDKSGVRD